MEVMVVLRRGPQEYHSAPVDSRMVSVVVHACQRVCETLESVGAGMDRERQVVDELVEDEAEEGVIGMDATYLRPR